MIWLSRYNAFTMYLDIAYSAQQKNYVSRKAKTPYNLEGWEYNATRTMHYTCALIDLRAINPFLYATLYAIESTLYISQYAPCITYFIKNKPQMTYIDCPPNLLENEKKEYIQSLHFR